MKNFLCKYAKFISTLAVAFAAFHASIAHSMQADFYSPAIHYPYTGSLYWPVLSGFKFNPYWQSNDGRDSRNSPFIPGNIAAVTSTFGSFTFNSLSIGGWPWDNFGMSQNLNNNPIPLTFLGDRGDILETRYISVEANNSFKSFSETIYDVSTIYIGSPSFTTLNVRIGSIVFNESVVTPVPEPSTLELMTAGAIIIIMVKRWRIIINHSAFWRRQTFRADWCACNSERKAN